MYRGFNLTGVDDIKNNSFYDEFKNLASKIYEDKKAKIFPGLKEYIVDNMYIDATKMQAEWFPQDETMHVFISHSHNDKELALALAGILSCFDLNVFIDSCIWEYSPKLLKKIDKKCCWQEESGTYSYEKRNYSTAHVNIMLANALTRMMDQTECIIFLNTNNSVNFKSGIKSMTYSPWLFHEIAMTKVLKSKPRSREIRLSAMDESLQLAHTLDFAGLTEISYSDFESKCRSLLDNDIAGERFLDELYSRFPHE